MNRAADQVFFQNVNVMLMTESMYVSDGKLNFVIWITFDVIFFFRN